nr:hypothetical protein CFP56_20384 [Quercus suber]
MSSPKRQSVVMEGMEWFVKSMTAPEAVKRSSRLQIYVEPIEKGGSKSEDEPRRLRAPKRWSQTCRAWCTRRAVGLRNAARSTVSHGSFNNQWIEMSTCEDHNGNIDHSPTRRSRSYPYAEHGCIGGYSTVSPISTASQRVYSRFPTLYESGSTTSSQLSVVHAP